MAEESSMKPPKEEEEEDGGGGVTDSIDRLSNLPDSLLCHIMSFLPTRTSVATMSLVSPRYLNLWKDLQVFDFYFHRSIPFERVSIFVNSVLSLRKSRDIQKFHLTLTFDRYKSFDIRKFEAKCVEIWILDAIGPHLQELILSIAGSCIRLPPSFFIDCTNLVCLRLSGAVDMLFKHSSVHFPSLKTLSLGADIVLTDSLITFLSGCPSLETLQVYFYFISAQISSTKVPVTPPSSVDGNFTWTYFDINEGLFKLGIVGNFHSMLEAFLHVFSLTETEFVDPILNLIRDDNSEFHSQLLVNEEDVYLLSHHLTSKWPIHAPVLDYPEFRDLHHLKLILPCFNSNLLVHVLEQCHMLQVLLILSNKEEPPPLRTWQPESTTVSQCLESHLTYIHIEGYQGLEDELTFAEYILRNGLVLKTMLIFVDISMDKKDKDCSLKRLTDIPRGSIMCQLEFDPAVSP